MTAQALHDQLQDLADRAEITDLADRYLLSLDAREFDEPWARSMFTDDIRAETPVGGHEGIDGMVKGVREALERFERTQHVGSNHVIRLDGDRATVGLNAIMTHVHLDSTQALRGREPGELFVVGGRIDGEAVRTADGWRFRRMAIRVTWTTGEPPILPPGLTAASP
ncbi:nuclear transport factor 2 family protein [Streptomyces sp. 8N616]|uniref:nuclear transport factor 2 family protein n=1 Tax=Streptomyces sp. 8N616 TaxID=3457414 RepID=UPI003FD259CE